MTASRLLADFRKGRRAR